MNYVIRIIKNGDVVSVERLDEPPTEDHLNQLVAAEGADFADISRT